MEHASFSEDTLREMLDLLR